MTDQTPATEAGRLHLDQWHPDTIQYERERADILAIEAEARADALREAADAVRAGIPALTVELSTGQYVDVDAIVAILDPQP